MAFETVSETLNSFRGRGLTAPTGSDLYCCEGTGAVSETLVSPNVRKSAKLRAIQASEGNNSKTPNPMVGEQDLQSRMPHVARRIVWGDEVKSVRHSTQSFRVLWCFGALVLFIKPTSTPRPPHLTPPEGDGNEIRMGVVARAIGHRPRRPHVHLKT